jgi:hypothetical protein
VGLIEALTGERMIGVMREWIDAIDSAGA